MFDPNLPEFTQPVAPVGLEGPRVQAFVTRHRPFFILLGVLIGQLLLLSFQITRNHDVRLIRVWAIAVFNPFERFLWGAADATSQAGQTFRGLWQARQQNQELNVELVAARSRIQQLSEEASETQRLRKLLDFKDRLPFATVAAEVIATSPSESSKAIFIDKGLDAGLTPDLAVITPEGIVGKTIDVFAHSAQVLLITDSSSGVGAMVERDRLQGVMKGEGENLCRLHYIMNEESVLAGELVVTSGLDQIYPKGLPLGTVAQTGEGNIYKNIMVKPTVSLNRLEDVLVILKPNTVQQQALNLPPHP